MNTVPGALKSLFESTEQYAKTSIELSKLKAIEAGANIASVLLSRISVIIAIALFTIFVNIGIALMLGNMFGKTCYGFFIVALFYLVAGVVFHFFLYKWVKKPVSDLIVTQALQ